MSNVKTGDLAWLMSAKECPWPTCVVGKQATGIVQVRMSSGIISEPYELVSEYLHWWCSFREPIQWGTRGSPVDCNTVIVYSDYFPVVDFFLKKISDGEMKMEWDDWMVLSSSPIDSDERYRERERKDKLGIVIPRRTNS